MAQLEFEILYYDSVVQCFNHYTVKIPPSVDDVIIYIYIYLSLYLSISITKTIQVRWTRYAGYCWRSRDKLISDILLWTPSHGQAKAGQPARTYIQQFCADTGCSLEALLGGMDNKDRWWERIREIHAGNATG